jgi:hypothetical protein
MASSMQAFIRRVSASTLLPGKSAHGSPSSTT